MGDGVLFPANAFEKGPIEFDKLNDPNKLLSCMTSTSMGNRLFFSDIVLLLWLIYIDVGNKPN